MAKLTIDAVEKIYAEEVVKMASSCTDIEFSVIKKYGHLFNTDVWLNVLMVGTFNKEELEFIEGLAGTQFTKEVQNKKEILEIKKTVEAINKDPTELWMLYKLHRMFLKVDRLAEVSGEKPVEFFKKFLSFY